MKTAKATGFKKHLPNIVSIARIGGSFSLPFLMSWETTVQLPLINIPFHNVPYIWLIVYLFLVLTDKIDGTLARRLNAESDLGAALDALGDVIMLAMGATLCFVFFARAQLGLGEFWIYVGMMLLTIVNKIVGFMFAKKYHGKGNMLHSYPQRLFGVSGYIAVAYWAFVRDIPAWSIDTLLIFNIYATIDECIYCIRSAEYNVDFKGHGFEKYLLRKK
jgi:CDP-diacylglycerol--glycerol-3-phosphate 3-phosphatidyltransferase